jgi:hypothetical protein
LLKTTWRSGAQTLMAVLSVAKLSVTGYGHSPEQPVAKIFVVFCNGPITRQNGFEVYPDPCMCPSPESMFGDGHKRYRSSSHSGLCTGASARILLLQRASSYCRSLRLSWEMSQSQDGMAMCGHVWPVWGRADPPQRHCHMCLGCLQYIANTTYTIYT